jgi:hypothetical protein
MKAGDRVTWMHIPRGGYGYSLPIDAEIVKLHAKHATVKVKKRSGEVVRRRVTLSSLREKPTWPHGPVREDNRPMNCLHTRIERGRDVPRVWGSWRTQVCLDCGAFRMHAHNEDPSATPGWCKSAWRSAGEYDGATAESENP